MLNPAFISSFCRTNIINAFRKCGACPFNKDSVPIEAIAPSLLTNKPTPHGLVAADELEKVADATDHILSLPGAPIVAANPNKTKRDSKAKCLNDFDNDVSMNEPSTQI